ncbi:ATP-binding protein [Pseudonocardia sp. NPDC046786]|uniref:ATP-binding protein n=1 Tax=Pseudonocardia sp. NPDC046786 TaxID=3155471 RepID=UPI0033C762E6
MAAHLVLELTAEPRAARRARREVGRWLASLCGAEHACETASDLVLAVNEAVSNSVEHAYGDDPLGADGTVTLRAEVQRPGPRVRVQVSDHGCWRDPPEDNGHRGRGLLMITACAEDVSVRPGADGTTVTLHRTLGRCPGVCTT